MSKPGTAMAHLDSPQAAKNAIHHLHGHKLLGQTLELNYSRHSYIADYSQGGTLPDGNPCWKDFSQSRNNRSVMFVTMEICNGHVTSLVMCTVHTCSQQCMW